MGLTSHPTISGLQLQPFQLQLSLAMIIVRRDSPGNVCVEAEFTVHGLVTEAWGQGFMVGALVVLIFFTVANMRSRVWLHKLILIEVSATHKTIWRRDKSIIIVLFSWQWHYFMARSSFSTLQYKAGTRVRRQCFYISHTICITSSTGSKLSHFCRSGAACCMSAPLQ